MIKKCILNHLWGFKKAILLNLKKDPNYITEYPHPRLFKCKTIPPFNILSIEASENVEPSRGQVLIPCSTLGALCAWTLL